MVITEVRIHLSEPNNKKLLAFCSITLDGVFVIHDLKLIQSGDRMFLAMPSRRLTSKCETCRHKNHLKARYCNLCGVSLKMFAFDSNGNHYSQLYDDVAHPITPACRNIIQETVVAEYLKELRNEDKQFHQHDCDDEHC